MKGDVIEWVMKRGDRRQGTVVRVSMLGAGVGEMEVKDNAGKMHYGIKRVKDKARVIQRSGGGGSGGRG